MWTRKMVKSDAKKFLFERNNYWKAFLVCIIVSLIIGGGTGSGRTAINSQIEESPGISIETEESIPSSKPIVPSAKPVSNVFIAFTLLITVIFLFFLNPLLLVGKNKYFIEGIKYGKSPEVSTIFSTIRWGESWPIIKTVILKRLYIFLWTLLFIIPGIIKSYEYYFVEYLLAEDATLTTKEAIYKSRQMTNGNKFNIFILEMSFFGWYLLGTLALGIGILFVNPYRDASLAALYTRLNPSSYESELEEENLEEEILY